MNNFTPVTKFLAAATVVGALGLAYAQTNSTPPATDKSTATGTPTGQTDNSSMGTSSNTGSTSTNTRTTMGNSPTGSTSDSSTSGMSGERTARADRN